MLVSEGTEPTHNPLQLIQISGVAELSVLEDFTGTDSLGDHINNRFRRLLVTSRPYLEAFEEFRKSVVDNEEEIIAQLTQVF